MHKVVLLPNLFQMFSGRRTNKIDDGAKPYARTRIWLRTIVDLVRTAPREHLEKIRKENNFMHNLRTDLLAIGGCILIILAALLLLNYGRSHLSLIHISE